MTLAKYLPYFAGWQALVGAWMVIAPFVLGFADHVAATASSIAAGVACLIGTGAWYYAASEHAAQAAYPQQKAA